ncbi:glutaminyl-peptide cyclotransferase [Flavobacterium piscinae]|uniref:Glutaminyl-peptide cyclotransferase n=1 Tax=Flavobacterium piscinae TaxID=2506424 RepID=A0A4Q1KMN7_9FLAO|nr:glutaminyl-peptide cyclotransferase [Flavobacterium piscinae]RXR31263.1 glutaminyl-peptide cyclotransferase [Flavobacterium piscinae]
MKKYNLFSFICLAVLFFSCENSKKSNSGLFQLNTTPSKAQFTTNEKATLSISNTKNKQIDSIVFFANSKKISTILGNKNIDFQLTNQKLGYQNLKALVYFENEYAEVTHRIELISKIEPKLLSYTLINSYPHDSKAYTQGLEFHRDTLYEGTGNGAGNATGVKGISSLRKTNFKTGEVYKKIEYPEIIFGEGITILNNKVYQLTWQNGFGFIYDADNFTEIKRFNYSKRIQGWGLCNDGKMLYQSDGTEKIYMLNPETMLIESNINVYSGANKIKSVNELEWINGKIYGNIYQKDAIAVINPSNGEVEAVLYLGDLKKLVTLHPDIDVLNGIAYNPKSNTIFVTGKNWDKLFEIKVD